MRRRRFFRWWPPGVLVLAVLCAYAGSFSGPFIYDDLLSIPGNNTIRHLWPLWNVFSPPGGDVTVAGRPLLNLSFALDYAIGGLSVWVYHATNLLIHVAAALLAFGVVRRTLLSIGDRATGGSGERGERGGMDDRGATSMGFAAALLWATHPLQTESVTYMVQRAESLMGLFYLATLYCAIRGAAGRRRTFWTAAATVACALGMATKEVMVTAPFVVMLYDRAFLASSFRESIRRRWLLYVALFSTEIVLVAFSFGARGATVGVGIHGIGAFSYALTQTHVILHYLSLGIWPHPLVFDYSWPVAGWNATNLALAVPVVALGLGSVWLWTRHKGAGFAAISFFVILAPSSSFVPIATEIASEHRMYLPLLALVSLGVVGMYRLTRSRTRTAFPICVAGVAAVFVLLAFQRNRDYRSDVSIWERTVADRPSPGAFTNLALAYENHHRFEDAAATYRDLLKTDPNNAENRNGLGAALLQMGRDEEGIGELESAVKLNPNYAEAHLNLAAGFAALDRPDAAIQQCLSAIALRPGYAMAHYDLAVLLKAQGRDEEARKQFELARHYDPGFNPDRQAGVQTKSGARSK